MHSPRKPIAPPRARTGSAESALEEVLRVLWRLLEDAHDVEAGVGLMRGADWAL